MGEMKNRKQIGINLPHAQIEWLKNKSKTTGAPVSRIVEKIINNETKKEMSNMKKVYYVTTNGYDYIATKDKNGIRVIDESSFRENWFDKIKECEEREEAAKYILNDFVSDPNSDDTAFDLITKENDKEFYNGIMKDINENWNYYSDPDAPRVLTTAKWDC